MACVPGSEADVLPAWKQDLGQQQREGVPVTEDRSTEWITVTHSQSLQSWFRPKHSSIASTLHTRTDNDSVKTDTFDHLCRSSLVQHPLWRWHTMKCGIKQHPHDTVYLPNEWTVTSLLHRRLLEETFLKPLSFLVSEHWQPLTLWGWLKACWGDAVRMWRILFVRVSRWSCCITIDWCCTSNQPVT